MCALKWRKCATGAERRCSNVVSPAINECSPEAPSACPSVLLGADRYVPLYSKISFKPSEHLLESARASAATSIGSPKGVAVP